MKISIITPVFNREDTLLRCLESVTVALTENIDIEVEHIVVDDGSKDSSPYIIEEYAKTHNYVIPIRFQNNRGVAAARNAATAVSSGDYCLFLDSDDWLDSKALHNILYAVTTFPDKPYYLFMCDDRMNEFKGLNSGHIFTFHDFIKGSLNGDFSHLVSSHIMKKYPFDEQLRIFESFNHLKCQREARNIVFINRVMTHIERNRCDSVSLTYIRTNKDVIRRKFLHAKLSIEEFESDYIQLGLYRQLADLYMEAADNSLLLSNYTNARTYLSKTRNGLKKLILSAIATLRLGRLYRYSLQFFLSLKYKMPERGVH